MIIIYELILRVFKYNNTIKFSIVSCNSTLWVDQYHFEIHLIAFRLQAVKGNQ